MVEVAPYTIMLIEEGKLPDMLRVLQNQTKEGPSSTKVQHAVLQSCQLRRHTSRVERRQQPFQWMMSPGRDPQVDMVMGKFIAQDPGKLFPVA